MEESFVEMVGFVIWGLIFFFVEFLGEVVLKVLILGYLLGMLNEDNEKGEGNRDSLVYLKEVVENVIVVIVCIGCGGWSRSFVIWWGELVKYGYIEEGVYFKMRFWLFCVWVRELYWWIFWGGRCRWWLWEFL